MKKLFVVAFLIAVVAAVALPYATGMVMEKTIHTQLDRYNQTREEQPFYPHIEIARYERGFRSSQIEWVVSMPQLQQIADIDQVILLETAEHGYLAATSTIDLKKNDWYQHFIDTALAGKDPLTIANSYSLTSGLASAISLDSVELKGSSGEQINLRPAKIHIAADEALENIKTKATFAGFSIPETVDIGALNLTSDIRVISSIIMDGDSEMTLESITIAEQGKPAVSIEDIAISTESDYDQDNKKLTSSAQYDIAVIDAGGKKAEDIHLGLAIENIDSDGLESFYAAYTEMLKDVVAATSAMQENPDQARTDLNSRMIQSRMRMMAELEKLLTKDLMIKLSKLHVGLPEGDIDGDLTIGLKRDVSLVDFTTIAMAPETLLDVFSLSSDITLPSELIPERSSMLYPLMPGMPTGVFVQQDDKLTHKAEIKAGKLMLNGQEFVLKRY